jgi:hypothetical protein
MRECTLAGSLPGSVHIHHYPLLSHPVEQAAGGRKRAPSEQILLKACTQSFHSVLVEGGKKAREG